MNTIPLSEAKARLSEIADEVGRTHERVHITRNGREYVVLLAAEDLVEYTDNPAHRRSKLVRLTPLGTELLALITGRQITWTNELAEAMPVGEKELRAALDVLRQLRVELERPHRGQLPGQ